MKLLLSLFIVLFIIGTSSQMAFTSNGLPPYGTAGVPGTNNCNACHAGALNSGPAIRTITFNGNPNLTSYNPGQEYTIIVTISQAGMSRFGFQMAARTPSNQAAGMFVSNHFTTDVNWDHISHASGATIPFPFAGLRKWSFVWQAPGPGTGTVSFYMSAVAANGNNNAGGDFSYTNIFTLTEGPMIPLSGNIQLLNTANVCAGDSINIWVQGVNFNSFPPNNQFSIQLSDSLGNFDTPITLSSTPFSGGYANAHFPSSLPTGQFYHIRLASSNPLNYSKMSRPFSIGHQAAIPIVQWDGRTFTANTDSALTIWNTANNTMIAIGNLFTPTYITSYAAGHLCDPCQPSMSPFVQVSTLINLSNSLIHSGQRFCEGDSIDIQYSILGNSFSNVPIYVEFENDSNRITTATARVLPMRTIRTGLPPASFGTNLKYRLFVNNPLVRTGWSGRFTLESFPETPQLRLEGMTLKTAGGGILRWFMDGSEIQGATADSLDIAANGTYAAVRLGNSCQSDTSNAIVVSNVSVNELAKSGITFYPNPVHDLLIIEASQKGNLELINGSGVSIFNQRIEPGFHTIELKSFPAGIYMLMWRNGVGRTFSRIVKF